MAPPDGSANLTLVAPKPDRPEYKLIGGNRWVLFMTEDVHAKSQGMERANMSTVAAPMPKAIEFGGITPVLRVRDVRVSTDYYVRVLGFKINFQTPGFVSFSRGRCAAMRCANCGDCQAFVKSG